MADFEEIRTPFAIGAHMSKALTPVQVDALTEIMQSHMDRATTFGVQSQNLIAEVTKQSHFLSHHLFPTLGAISYPTTTEVMFEQASDEVEKLADLLEQWGKTLSRLDREYTAMIGSIQEFHRDNLVPKLTDGGNGNVVD